MKAVIDPRHGTQERRVAQAAGQVADRSVTVLLPGQPIDGSPRMVAQRRRMASTLGATGALREVGVEGRGTPQPAAGAGVAQLADLLVGRGAAPAVRSQADVLAAHGRGDSLHWPTEGGTFNADYAGSVQRAMVWGHAGGEGVAGWYDRYYDAADFDAIATAAGNATNGLAPVPELDNEKNKTLLAIRAFRGPNNGAMAGQTLNDLQAVHGLVTGLAPALFGAGLINNAGAALVSIEADPAEAHPNTLPTAKVTYAGGQTVYFKGRDQSVENALVGSGPSAAVAISSLGGRLPAGAEGVGTHGFVDPGGVASTNQIAKDVGAEVAPALTPVTALESFRSHMPSLLWGADVPPRPEATNAWISAAKTALLVALTATSDLHASNVVSGASGKAHVIDAEFLLDITLWQSYQNMLTNGVVAGFDVQRFAPRWLVSHMRTQSAGTKRLMADAVEAAFLALNADKTYAWLQIVAPIRQLLTTQALLRVAPLETTYLLRQVTEYHEAVGALAKNQVVVGIWNAVVAEMAGKANMANAAAAQVMIDNDLQNGMVPLFHVRANNGDFMLDKAQHIGQAVHSPSELLDLAGAAVSAQYGTLAARVRAAVTA